MNMLFLYIAIVLFMAVNRPDLIYGRRVGELGSLWILKLGGVFFGALFALYAVRYGVTLDEPFVGWFCLWCAYYLRLRVVSVLPQGLPWQQLLMQYQLFGLRFNSSLGRLVILLDGAGACLILRQTRALWV
ncbi:hypothetical protein [Chromobacterium haemolyticum]|uniref:hypothetical protein n=1 Tax=Chromobacterium haemolyticum TaxID=394935 RepID=UPI0011B21D99|nr:hypothetical protein [Chromobacterium haemolyticum]